MTTAHETRNFCPRKDDGSVRARKRLGFAQECAQLRIRVYPASVCASATMDGKMSHKRRLNTTIDAHLSERLDRETDGRTPRLPRRYVIELALKRLFDEIDRGQFELDLTRHD
jgi:hypothetical protein